MKPSNVTKLSVLSLALCTSFALTACGSAAGSSSGNTDTQTTTESQSAESTSTAAVSYEWDFVKENGAIADLESTACANQGTVVTLEYDCPAYAINDLFSVDETIHKKLNVYLPYGYDENTEYDILYLLHGTKGTTDPEMQDFWLLGEQWGESTRNLLDNMIDQGLCKPLIVVTPTYYSEVDGYEITDTELNALAEKLNGDSYIVREVAADGGEPDNEQNVWPCYFGQELRNDIIPLVESQYSTYADKDTGIENLISTRDHRAMAGLSRGSMTVVRSGLMQNTDIISYFGCYSGIWTEYDQFKQTLENDYADYAINFWYNGNGRGDFALDDHRDFNDKVLSDMSDRFTDGENYAWVSLKDGAHMYKSWAADLYNSLLVFFTR